jgi:chaperonin GroEL
MGKIIRYENEARLLVFQGIEDMYKAVVKTLGPRGSCVILDQGNGHQIITKDGVSVARFISFSDKYKNIGASLVKEAANKTNQSCGDGTTTAALLTYELIKEAMHLAAIGIDRNEIKKGYELAKDHIFVELDKRTIKLSSSEDIFHVATVSANNDEDIGKVIQEAFEGIGDDGIITILDSYASNGKTTVKFTSGFEIGRGFTTSLFANTRDNTYETDSPSILLYDKPIDEYKHFIPILDIASKKELNLVIIAPGFDTEFHTLFCSNIEKNNLQGCLIRAPGFTKQSIDDQLQDLAILLGTKVFNKDSLLLFNPGYDFGVCSRLKVSSLKTQFIEPIVKEEALNMRCQAIKAELNRDDTDEFTLSEMERGALKERLAKLTGGVATIYVGANSSIELKEKFDRFEDAVNAVRAAISDGITSGGGSALAKAAYACIENSNNVDSSDKNKAYKAFLEVCTRPALAIIKSTDIPKPELTLEKEMSDKDLYAGVNAKTSEYCKDLLKEGVVDPVKVLKCAIKYSTSIAATFALTDVVIIDESQNIKVDANDPVIDSQFDDIE